MAQKNNTFATLGVQSKAYCYIIIIMNEIDYTKISDQVSQQINDSFGGAFAGVAIGSVAITGIILVVWTIGAVRKWKMQKAVYRIQKDLHEMNERQKGSHTTPQQTTEKK